jgi:hypothetical protein
MPLSVLSVGDSSIKKIVLLGGGTVNHVRNHLAVAAPAYGSTVRQLLPLFERELCKSGLDGQFGVEVCFTKMADHASPLETNVDVARFVDQLIADPQVRVVVFNVALADFEGSVEGIESGKHAQRLKTSAGAHNMQLTPAEKLIGRIRRDRKDIFVVGFKTTTGATPDEQYAAAMGLLKNNSLNLVVANDTVTRHNLIAAPEETRYCSTTDRAEVLAFLAKMTVSRMQNRFTRSTVVPGEAIAWSSDAVPANLREVVDHCINQGAYKPVLGKTAGHFAVKVSDGEILTSIRKSNFNALKDVGLVHVQSRNDDEVIAHGFRPSVGGQSQRIIFREHPDLDCIVHFHCPVKADAPLKQSIPVKPQWPNECGSHQCGQTTSRGLNKVDLGDGDSLSVVFLDDHGPNIVFSRTTPAHKVRDFIDVNFDLRAKTGGLAAMAAH